MHVLSSAFTLDPGDVIFTGTPAGVGGAMKPPQFLRAGDRVRVEIDRIGAIENVAAAGATETVLG
ncbi:MAG TPA: fumarylacetoacetate hydrolase family protein [Pseudomonadales bacterium]|nr:fumarylacetoacetate hydrolase family protein [Pseudomonadales bacterium]